jgi:hypothetical protein
MPNALAAADTATAPPRQANGSGITTAVHDPAARQSGLPIDPSVQARRTTLRLPERLAYADWRRIGTQISLISNASSWWLGDWLIYGQERYPDRYRIAVSETSLDYGTLRNYAWVARKFPMSRRRDTLSFQHHVEVASLAEADQDIWLERAARFKWSKAELRKRLRAGAEPQVSSGNPAALSFNIGSEQRRRWQEAADAAQCTLAEWVIQVADAAAVSAMDPVDGVIETVDGVIETVDGVIETVDGVIETADGAMAAAVAA